MAITDSWLRSTNGKPQENMVTKSDRDGLSVRVTPKGKIIFQFRYRWDGKGDRIDIGVYPAISLKEARDNVTFYRGELGQHRNPKIVKQLQKEAVLNAVTVEELIRNWWTATMEGSKVAAHQILRGFEIYVFPKIGSIPHDETTLHIWLSLIENVSKHSPTTGARILSYSKKAHKWAVRRAITNNTPLSDVMANDLANQSANISSDENKGEDIGGRTLSEDELIILFKIINSSKYNLRNALIVKLALLFGCRIGELLKAKLNDFDYEKNIWTVPPANHKTGRKTKKPLVRPIIPAAKKLIEQAKQINEGSQYLFVLVGGKPFSTSKHCTLIERLSNKMANYFDDSYKSWSIHDLRRTMRTEISELTSPHVAEIMIGHKLPGIWQVYDKHTYLNEQREAYERWWTLFKILCNRHFQLNMTV